MLTMSAICWAIALTRFAFCWEGLSLLPTLAESAACSAKRAAMASGSSPCALCHSLKALLYSAADCFAGEALAYCYEVAQRITYLSLLR